MHGLWPDLKLGLRTLVGRPALSLVVILALGVGIGSNTAMFSLLNAALIQPLPYPEPDRLVLGYTDFDGGSGLGFMSAPDYFDCRDEADAFESLAAIQAWNTRSTITGGERPERVDSTVISHDLLSTLGVSPDLGRGFTPEDARPGAPRVALVSHGVWQRQLNGSPQAIESTLTIDGRPYFVIGVMPAGFHIRSKSDIWMPMVDAAAAHLPRRMHNWYSVGRLRPGVTLEQARAQVALIARRLEEQHPDSNRGKGLGLTPLHEAFVQGDWASLLALMGAVTLVLLIACANVAGLLFARGCTRRQELALRAALGASRARLVRQLVIENAVLTLAAAVFGLLLASWLQATLLQVIPLEALGVREVHLDSTVLVFALALSVATVLLSGLAPALRGGRGDLVVDLHAGARATDTRGGTRLRAALITGQVTLSIVLLVCAGLLIRSLAGLRAVDLGFRAEGLLTAEIQLPDSRYPDVAQRAAFATTLLERARALPGVESAGLISLLPVREPRNNTRAWAADAPPAEQTDGSVTYVRSVLPGYFESMGIPLRAGRDLREGDREGAAEVTVINERLARDLFPDRDALGREVVIDYPGSEAATVRVVGIVGDVHLSGPGRPVRGVSYASYLQRQTDVEMQLALRASGDPSSLVAPLRSLVGELDPEVPLSETATMEHLIDRGLSDHETVATLVSIFAAVAMLLASLGLYGMLTFYVGQRTREIGLRMALGAAGPELLVMVIRRGMTLVLIGLALGIAGSWGATRLLGHLLFGVPATDPVTLLGSTLVFAGVGLVACLLPAWRATRIDPAISLTAE